MYEPRYLRVLNYTYDSEEDIPNTDFKMRKYYDGGSLDANDAYGSSANSTMNIGPAYNLNLVQGQVGCKGCDDDITKNFTVDGKSYPQAD
jgi:hypothetical protein